MLRLSIAFVAVAGSFAARAADKMSHSVVGWSADGRYFAFERSVMLDGSGYPMCEVAIIDADSGELSAGPFKAVLEDTRILPEHACVAARSDAQGAMEFRRIDPALKGKRLKLAQTAPPAHIGTAARTIGIKFREGARACILLVTETPARSEPPEWVLYAWHLGLSCDGEEHMLRCTECDKEPPLAAGIRIVEVRSHQDRIAVFLERSTRGFEGFDVTPIVSASRLPVASSGRAADGGSR